VKENIVFWIIQKKIYFWHEFEDSLSILKTCVDIAFVIHSSKVFKQSLKYFEYIKSNVFSTSHEYIVGLTICFQCASLIELNAWEEEWFVDKWVLQEAKRESKKANINKTSFKS
jgi:hypothetical protein